MEVLGRMFVAGREVAGEGSAFHATLAATGAAMEPVFCGASTSQIEAALAAADAATIDFGDSAPQERADLLEAMGAAILGIGDGLIERVMAETGLPRQRLEGERMRTVNQLHLFAGYLRDGFLARSVFDPGDPDRPGAPKPELRLGMLAVGPVAVFGASNFPLAFSVAGGDTASALAAGCPVVVKGHPAHPGTSELVARALTETVKSQGFAPGVFSMLQDGGITVGEALVSDCRIAAVGFTGSRRAGEALMRLAANRTKPIPVFAEMGSINPVLLCPARLDEAAEQIAAAFVASLTLGTGQFCTNPGLVLAIEGQAFDRFAAAAAAAITATAAGTMLSPGICRAYSDATKYMANVPGVMTLAQAEQTHLRGAAMLFAAEAEAFLAHQDLQNEMFGPAALLVRCKDVEQMATVVSALDGQLTVAIHYNDADRDIVARLLPRVRRKAGRVLANGFGTGVEVSPSMVHGGPWPACSDSRTSSVGTIAMDRFLRPVCHQDFGAGLRSGLYL